MTRSSAAGPILARRLFGVPAVLLAVAAFWAGAGAQTPAPADATLHVGLRRSSYGLRAKNGDHAWWADRAKAFAANFAGAKPTVIEIVSTYQERDGSTEFEFEREIAGNPPAAGTSFSPGGLDHEKALAEYDAKGVQALLQFEPGSADVTACIDAAWRKFGGHACVIGFGVDAEWFHTKASAKKEGRPITDAEAKAWMEKVLALNPRWVLFLKHWDASHMPPTYRHPQLIFISDSQDFKSRAELMDDFKGWAKALKGATSGYQFGYPKDRPWWSKMKSPAVELANGIRAEIPSSRWLFWVDFTADQIDFR